MNRTYLRGDMYYADLGGESVPSRKVIARF